MRAISSMTTISASGPRNDSGSSPEKHTHIAPFGHSSRRRDDTQRGRGSRPQVANIVMEVGRCWSDEVNALYLSAHRGMHRRAADQSRESQLSRMLMPQMARFRPSKAA